MTVTTVEQLQHNGPDHCETMTADQAVAWCRRLATSRYENFSVLSRLVPRDRRNDFAAVYAFCRWADDLGDEIADPQRALELLAWWRRELRQCFADEPRHPVFVALHPTIRKHDLPIKPFDDLIRAFEQDQEIRRYDSWDQLIGYCRLSAEPVGRIVLMVLGEDRTEENFGPSDDICTALQLTNHWQDIRRDIVDRDRIYIPLEMNNIERFEERLVASARQGYGTDREFLGETREVVRALVDRTWPYFERGEKLLGRIDPASRPVVWLFAAGGQHVLRTIEQWSCETAIHRPTLSGTRKLMLVGQAMFMARFGMFGNGVA